MKNQENRLELTFINVGYGEAVFLQAFHNNEAPFTAMIDGGSGSPEEYVDTGTGRIPAAVYLKQTGISGLDLVIPTHIHEDHVSGLAKVLKDIPAKQAFLPLPDTLYKKMHHLDAHAATTASGKLFRSALNDYIGLCMLLAQHGSKSRQVKAGECYMLYPGVACHILGPDPQKQTELADRIEAIYAEKNPEKQEKRIQELDACMNHYSIMLRIDFGRVRILLPGDTNKNGYRGIGREELRADLFKVGHHGQKDGADEDLILRISPKITVCCASSERRYNSADPELLSLFRKHGSRLYFSDCPEVEGETIPAHQALRFIMFEDGRIEAGYCQNLEEA